MNQKFKPFQYVSTRLETLDRVRYDEFVEFLTLLLELVAEIVARE